MGLHGCPPAPPAKGKCGIKIKDKNGPGGDDQAMAGDHANPLRILIPED